MEKHKKCNCKERRSVPKSQRDEDEKRRRKSADEPDFEEGTPETPASPGLRLSLTPSTAKPPVRGGNPDSHTSPQANWRNFSLEKRVSTPGIKASRRRS